MGKRIRARRIWSYQDVSDDVLKVLPTARLLNIYRQARKFFIYQDLINDCQNPSGVELLKRYKDELNRREHVPRLIQHESGKKKRAKN